MHKLRFILRTNMYARILSTCLWVLFTHGCLINATGQATLSAFMRMHPDANRLDSSNRVQVSILWPDTQSCAHWRHEEFGVNTTYYYPASLVKWPVLLLALEWLNEQGGGQWSSEAYLELDSPNSCQATTLSEQRRRNQRLETRQSIANDVQRILLVSDNKSYSRLFYLLGPEYIAQRLNEKGFDGTEILKAYDGCDADARKTWPGVTLMDPKGDTLFHRPTSSMSVSPRDTTPLFVGRAFMQANGTLTSPLDFSTQNKMPLDEALRMLQSFLNLDSLEKPLWNLHPKDREMVLDAMHRWPRESAFSDLQKRSEYPDDYKKFLYYGNHNKELKHGAVEVYNIVGMAYGFMSDLAWIVDARDGRSVLVAATVYANLDEVLNDGHYDYDQLAAPFLEALGKWALEQAK